MRTRTGIGLSVPAALLLLAGSAIAAPVTFPAAPEMTQGMTQEEYFSQSTNYKDGVLTLGDETFTFDEHGNAIYKEPDGGLLCRWFGWFCPGFTAGPMQLTLKQAESLVLAKVLPDIQAEMRKDTGRELPILAFAWNDAIAKGTPIYVDAEGTPPMNVASDSWFIFLDLEPAARWGHRAEFVLVDGNTGEIRRRRVFAPPIIDGYELRQRDIFYPEDPENLPESAPWPLQFEKSNGERLPEPTLSDEAAAIHTTSVAGRTWTEVLIPTVHADTPAAATDPCVGKGKKVGALISGETEGYVSPSGGDDGMDFAHDKAHTKMMLKGMGFAEADIHQYDPGTHPNLDDVFRDIADKAKDLGPCDKFFLYVVGHGAPPDTDADGKPEPSTSIGYGRGEGKGYIGKTRWAKNSIIRLLEDIKAGQINLMIDSCFSGSMVDYVSQHAAQPAAGSTWHLFLASPNNLPSYSLSDRPGGEYTDVMAYCVLQTLAQRGITNPTIAQMEDIMRECQKDIADNPQKYLQAQQVSDVQPVTFTVEPKNTSVVEGNDGTRDIVITVRRTPSDRRVSVRYETYSPDSAAARAFPGLDYQRIENGSITFEPGQDTVTIHVYVKGDTKVEPDEVFWLWFPDIRGQYTEILVMDDDGPPRSSSSSSSAQASSASSAGVSYSVASEPATGDDTSTGEGYVIELPPIGLGEKYDWGKLDYTIVPVCDPCKEIEDELVNTAMECVALEWEAAIAEAEANALDGKIAAAEKALKDAQAALDAFNNPKSSATSEGRTVTSSDLAVGNAYAREVWNKYTDGDLTAEGASDAWKAGPTAEDRERLKKQIQEDLEQNVDDAQDALDDLKDEQEDLQDDADDAQADIDECYEDLERLEIELEECKKKCTVKEEISSTSSSEEEGGDEDDDEEESSAATSTTGGVSDDGTAVKGSFTEVDGMDLEVDPIDYRTGQEDTKVTKMPGIGFRYCNIVQKRGYDDCKAQCKGTCVEEEGCTICKETVAASSSSTLKSSSISSKKAESSSKSSSSSSSTAPVAQCPSGKTADKDVCEDVCDHEGGICEKDNNGCYGCTVYECPSNTYDSCPSSCTGGCDEVGDGPKSCYVCKKSCTEVCAGEGYTKVGTDWTGYMLEYVNAYTCVSGATAQIAYATIGACTCSNQPSISIDSTPVVCRNTTCGDVGCNQSVSCQQGTTTVTVTCTWKGWESVGENQLRPVVGQ